MSELDQLTQLQKENKILKEALRLACCAECNLRSKYEMECIACVVDGENILSSEIVECSELLALTYIHQATPEGG